MSSFGGFGKPGQGAAAFTTEREILAQGFDAQQCLFKSIVISGATRDAGNTPTTILRPGLLLGRLSATGEYEEWDADTVVDGTQNIGAILWKEKRAQDFDANNVDRVFTALVGRGVLQASQLLIQGAAFVGHIDEYLARRQLLAANFQLDDDPFGYKGGQGYRVQTISAEDHTITADDNGHTFIYTHTAAAASTITLPAIKAGLEFDLLRGANSAEDFLITSAEGDNVIAGNDLSADSVLWTTTGQQIGAGLKARAIYLDTTLKWHFDLYTPPFGTGLTGGFAYVLGT